MGLLRSLSLAAKWAPSPGGAHDRHTNIATAIISLLHRAQISPPYPSVLKNPDLDRATAAITLRGFYRRFVLTRLRSLLSVTESFMSSNRWAEIKYTVVPSVCMRNNMESFYKHDSTGFQKYLSAVESGKATISGATLLPHELVAATFALGEILDELEGKPDSEMSLEEFRQNLQKTKIRVIDAQWKTLVERLKESGSIDNAIAICDVSGSMAYAYPNGVQPINPAIALSLILANLAKPPFNGGFITFSENPQFVRLDLTQPLYKLVRTMNTSEWGLNTDLNAISSRLILPLAVENRVPPEEMIKTLFVFSDMQFDDCHQDQPLMTEESREDIEQERAKWRTNYDNIKGMYEKSGYQMPRIVYWDLANNGTVEVDSEREGVAMMNGFSPAMLKVFMGEVDDERSVHEADEKDSVKTVNDEEFNPVSVMKKAVMKKSFDGLVVLD